MLAKRATFFSSVTLFPSIAALPPWCYAERLAALVQRQRQIESELDVTRNQASAALAAEPTPRDGRDKDDEVSDAGRVTR
jgi:hypothetical protein